MTVALRIFKANPNAVTPSYGTRYAACFDISACLKGEETVTVFTPKNEKVSIDVKVGEHDLETVTLKAGHRMLVPTGIIFDLPNYFSLRMHPRSGLSVKNGITLVNAEPVIDPDYVDPTFVALINHSTVDFVIKHGDRICQGEIHELATQVSTFHPSTIKPKRVGDRVGGFGSTGV